MEKAVGYSTQQEVRSRKRTAVTFFPQITEYKPFPEIPRLDAL
jgi:hypothetical protein